MSKFSYLIYFLYNSIKKRGDDYDKDPDKLSSLWEQN